MKSVSPTKKGGEPLVYAFAKDYDPSGYLQADEFLISDLVFTKNLFAIDEKKFLLNQ